jgi:hypothetical protein
VSFVAWYVFEFGAGFAAAQTELEAFETVEEAKRFALGALELMVHEGDDITFVKISATDGAELYWVGTFTWPLGSPLQWKGNLVA